MSEKFRKERVSTVRERKLITYCITSDDFLRAMRAICEPEYFSLGYAQRIWMWCRDYWDEYQHAPGKHIEDLFILNRENMDPADAEMLQTFLANLSADYTEPVRLEYDINNAKDYLTFQKASLLKLDIEKAIEAQDPLALKEAFSAFKNVETTTVQSTDIFNDVDDVVQAFQVEQERLFRAPGAFGESMGWISRGDFAAFQGFAKARKSWFLQYIAQLGEEAGCNVLLVDFEMTKAQRIRRIWSAIKRLPKRDKQVKIPIFYKDDELDTEEPWKVQHVLENRQGIVASPENVAQWQQQRKQYYRKGGLRIINFPPGSMTPEQLISYCKSLEYFQNFKVDVLVVDYADKMKGDGKQEWDKINSIWTKLRAFALSDSIAVVTASQSNRDAADGDSGKGNISGDIRKVAEVTCLMTISSTPAERELGLVRLKNEAVRDEEECFDSVYVSSCLDIGCAVLDSRFRSEVELDIKEEKKKSAGHKR